jgi:hypothetical protein
MIPNQIIKIEPNTNLEKLTKKLEQGVFINIFITRNFKAYEFVFCFKKITTQELVICIMLLKIKRFNFLCLLKFLLLVPIIDKSGFILVYFFKKKDLLY